MISKSLILQAVWLSGKNKAWRERDSLQVRNNQLKPTKTNPNLQKSFTRARDSGRDWGRDTLLSCLSESDTGKKPPSPQNVLFIQDLLENKLAISMEWENWWWSIAGDVLLIPKQGAPTLHSVDSVILSLSPRRTVFVLWVGDDDDDVGRTNSLCRGMGIIMRAESNPCQGLSPCLLTIQRKLSCLFWGHEVEGGLCLTHRCADREAVRTVRIFCAAEPPHMEEMS